MKERTEYFTAILGVFLVVLCTFIGISIASMDKLSSPSFFWDTVFFSMGVVLLYTYRIKRWDWKTISHIFISVMGIFWILYNVPVLLSVF